MNPPTRNAYAAYQKLEVDGLTPAEIVHRLYQRLHNRLQCACEAILKGKTAARGENLGRAMAIIGELQASLNLRDGGEIADNLYNLYSFLTMELAMAGIHNDAARLSKTIKIVEPLLEAWEQVVKGEKNQGKAEPMQMGSGGRQSKPFHVTY